MDKNHSLFPSYEMYSDFPGFSWMYEQDSSLSQIKWAPPYSMAPKPEPDGTDADSSGNSIYGKNSSGIDSNRIRDPHPYNMGPSTVPASFIPHTALAYADENNNLSWPMPHTPSYVTGSIYNELPYGRTASVPSLTTDADSQLSEDSLSTSNMAAEMDPQPTVLPRYCAPRPMNTPPIATHPESDTSVDYLGYSPFVHGEYEYNSGKTQYPTSPTSMTRRPLTSAISRISSSDRVRGGASSSKSSQIKCCPICHKKLRRDLTRHMRIHEAVADFACPFPRKNCAHKHGQFNRPYEFKKHLMNCHFTFDDPEALKNAYSLGEKLQLAGRCQCGMSVETIEKWITRHVRDKECPLIRGHE